MANPTQNIQSVPLFKLEIRHKTTLNTSVKWCINLFHKLETNICAKNSKQQLGRRLTPPIYQKQGWKSQKLLFPLYFCAFWLPLQPTTCLADRLLSFDVERQMQAVFLTVPPKFLCFVRFFDHLNAWILLKR